MMTSLWQKGKERGSSKNAIHGKLMFSWFYFSSTPKQNTEN